MKKWMRNVFAMLLAMVLLLSIPALAEIRFPSSGFRLPSIKWRPTVAPTEMPTPDPTVAPTEETPVAPVEAAKPAPDVEPEVPAGPALTGEAALRESADGMAGIVLTLPADAKIQVIGIEGDWAQVEVDGVTGYIYKDSVQGVEFPEETPVEGEKPAPKVTIFSSRKSVMTPGETVYLTSKLENLDGYEVYLQWQCNTGDGFKDIEGANGDGYSFAASVETLSYDWKLLVYYREIVE